MSKYFKNNKSEGDGENWTVQKSKVKPRSYSCKPDIGPSGDHQALEDLFLEHKPNFRINMWLNNIGSGSSQKSGIENELYKINEDYLEKINFIRRKLELTELEYPPTERSFRTKADKSVLNLDETKQIDDPDSHALLLNDECNFCGHSKMENESGISPPWSKVSNSTTHSSVRYKPPQKKPCRRHITTLADASALINTTNINYSETDVINIPCLNLDSEQFSQCNENKSVQCTSKDTEITDYTSHSTDRSKPNRYHQRNIGDNIDLVDVDLYVEPKIILKQPTNVPNKNCIKFLPITDDEIGTSDRSNKNEFYDDIVSNCSFSFGHAPLVPSHDSFFKSKKKPIKKRSKKRVKRNIGDKLDKSSIDVQRTFSETSDISDEVTEIGTKEIPAVHEERHGETFDNTLMTGLTVPPRIAKPVKLPFAAKLSELIHGVKCKKDRNGELEGYVFKDDICCSKNNNKPTSTYVRVGTEYNNYREAAEELLTRRETADMKENACLHKHSGRQVSTNKYNTKKRQSVEYDFYSLGLPPGSTNCDVLHLNQETEEDSDSECLRAVENCCCIRKIFKKKRSRFFSN